jgi:hypothetical protein
LGPDAASSSRPATRGRGPRSSARKHGGPSVHELATRGGGSTLFSTTVPAASARGPTSALDSLLAKNVHDWVELDGGPVGLVARRPASSSTSHGSSAVRDALHRLGASGSSGWGGLTSPFASLQADWATATPLVAPTHRPTSALDSVLTENVRHWAELEASILTPTPEASVDASTPIRSRRPLGGVVHLPNAIMELQARCSELEFRDLSMLIPEAHLFAQVVDAADKTSPPESIGDMVLLKKTKNTAAYKHGDHIILGIAGTNSLIDAFYDYRLINEKIGGTARFKEAMDEYNELRSAFPECKVSIGGHSLGGGIALEMLRTHPHLEGHLFNPAIRPERIAACNASGLHVHSIMGDPVSHPWMPFIDNRTLYLPGRKHRIWCHRLVHFVDLPDEKLRGLAKSEAASRLYVKVSYLTLASDEWSDGSAVAGVLHSTMTSHLSVDEVAEDLWGQLSRDDE